MSWSASSWCRVRYALPLGRLGSLGHGERIFDYRRAAVRRLLDERRAG